MALADAGRVEVPGVAACGLCEFFGLCCGRFGALEGRLVVALRCNRANRRLSGFWGPAKFGGFYAATSGPLFKLNASQGE